MLVNRFVFVLAISCFAATGMAQGFFGVNETTNHAVTMQYLEWAQATVDAKDAIKNLDDMDASEALKRPVLAFNEKAKDYQKDAKKFYKACEDYKKLLASQTWHSLSSKHSVIASFKQQDVTTVTLTRLNGKDVTVRKRHLGTESNKALDKIQRSQQDVVTKATVFARHVLDDKLLKDFPSVGLSELRFGYSNQDWQTINGKTYSGHIVRIRTDVKDSESLIIIDVADEEENVEIAISNLDEDSQLKAKSEWQDIKLLRREQGRFKAFSMRFAEARNATESVFSDREWRASPEYRISKRALVAADEWINSHDFDERGNYMSAVGHYKYVVVAYLHGDAKDLKRALNFSRLEIRRIQELLIYSGYGQIYARDSGGEGVHFTYHELWKLAKEKNIFREEEGE